MVLYSSAAKWIALLSIAPLVVAQYPCNPNYEYCQGTSVAIPLPVPTSSIYVCNPEYEYCGNPTTTLPPPVPSPSEPPCNPELEECPPPPGTTSTFDAPISDFGSSDVVPTPASTTSSEAATITTISEAPVATFSTSSSEAPITTSLEIPCVCVDFPCPCDASPSTLYTTEVHTITSCAPTVTDCPYGSLTTTAVPLPTYTPCGSRGECYTQESACRNATNANQAYCSAQLAFCLHQHPEHVTVYTTAFVDVCPTGLTTNTYTITKTCTSAVCEQPTTCPENFAVTTKVCHACEGKPTLTVTVPVPAVTGPYHNGTGATGTPVQPSCNGVGCPTSPAHGSFVTAGAEKGFAAEGTLLAVLGGLVGAFAWVL